MQLQVGVKALIRNEAGEYLFIRRSEKLAEDKQTRWDIPGGRIKPEEALIDALIREIDEETGLSLSGEPTILAAQDIFVSSADLHVVRLTYVTDAEGSLRLSDEHTDTMWMSIEEARKSHIDPYILKVFDMHEGAL